MRELVLTGLKEFWPEKEKDAIYLGPWCFSHNHKHDFWEQTDFHLAISPWKTADDVLGASLYISSLVDRILPPFSRLMNNAFRVDHSERFWRIHIIVWLSHWLGICLDRYQRLACFGDGLREKYTVKILDGGMCRVADQWIDYMAKSSQSHYYNLLLMSDIIDYGDFSFLVSQRISLPEVSGDLYLKPRAGNTENRYRRIKLFLKERSSRYLTTDIYLGNIKGISIFDRVYFWLNCYLRVDKKVVKDNAVKEVVDRMSVVACGLSFGAKNAFERIVEKILLRHIPDSLLVINGNASAHTSGIKVWVGNDVYQENHRIAEICENNGRWISVQHGGGYGHFLSFPIGKIEYEASREFVTWGWNYKHNYDAKYYALPSPWLSKLPSHNERKEQLVLIGTAHPAYYYRLHSTLLPEDYLGYLENKKVFLSGLNDKIRAKVRYRPLFWDNGINESEFIRKALPDIRFLYGDRLIKELSKSKLVVIDHMATSFLETFAMNVPTVLFWDPKHFVVDPFAATYFEALRSVGILHDAPDAAADRINEIWENTYDWWRQKEVQNVKDEFCHQFAMASKYWRKDWACFLKSLRSADASRLS